IHTYTQNIGSSIESVHGQICFSPDGKKLAWYDATTDLDILDFDRCTGQFSNLIHVDINDSAVSAGVAFSASSQFLYVSSTTYVYQFDMNAVDIAASKTTVAVWDTFYSPSPPAATVFYLAQLGPDGKIY